MRREVVVVVGGGASGTLAAAHLLRGDAGPRVIVVEPGEEVGRGVAFGTSDPLHLLNIRACDMSAFGDDPDHFAAWFGPDRAAPASSFLPRMRYGDYLTGLSADIERIPLAAEDVIPVVDGAEVVLSSGARLVADRVVLALGWPPPRWPSGLRVDDPRSVNDPWREDPIGRVDLDLPVLLVGTGLTAVDMMLSLHEAGHRQIIAASRHGLLPAVHPEHPAPPATLSRSPERPDARSLLAWSRTAAEGAGGWGAFVDGVRPKVDELWRSLSLDEQDRLLRHAHRRWEVIRHRMAPATGSRIEAMQRAGEAVILKGRPLAARPGPNGIDIELQTGRLLVGQVINCTGPPPDVRQTTNRLVARLLRRGVVRPGPHALGLDTDACGRVPGTAGALWVIGPLRRGQTWETTAVPEIRVQAASLARAIAADAASIGGYAPANEAG